ncbi:hypothetical protein BDQ94DRAFT_136733 [Aspergillus welwitschiae]|uniref:Uncharacterized protein n=1 Tax=Aspergillus welwitschiae TaxID=1341132 RepID=A0A3F3QFB9_9EURO|nr:hypothetical protein BDQ94DRAFT_136733 [Aspergillus welwitschiae]RDH37612.1 hypothetical protein BDQ94DRAFT_136733 [Aspergillus welwitschiae]
MKPILRQPKLSHLCSGGLRAQPVNTQKAPYTLLSSDRCHNITQRMARLNSGSPGLCKGQRNGQEDLVECEHPIRHPYALSLLNRAISQCDGCCYCTSLIGYRGLDSNQAMQSRSFWGVFLRYDLSPPALLETPLGRPEIDSNLFFRLNPVRQFLVTWMATSQDAVFRDSL